MGNKLRRQQNASDSRRFADEGLSDSAVPALLKAPLGLLNSLLSVLPRKYTIENAEGDQIGSFRKGFSLRTRYDIEVDLDAYGKELILASVVAIRYKALV
jgi:hypothetical protein